MEYEPLELERFPILFTCVACGAVVHNMTRHDQWHNADDSAGGRHSNERKAS